VKFNDIQHQLREGQEAIDRANAQFREIDPALWAQGQTIAALREELPRLESQRDELLRERPDLAERFPYLIRDRPLQRLYSKVTVEIEAVKAELIRRGERVSGTKDGPPSFTTKASGSHSGQRPEQEPEASNNARATFASRRPGRPRKDAEANEAMRLKAQGKSYAEIARVQKSTPEAIRRLIKSRRTAFQELSQPRRKPPEKIS
jgi:hypothetical protein